MCAVSAVVDSIYKQWPPFDQWKPQHLIDTQDIINRLAEIDKKLGAKDCVDAKKEEFLKALEARVKALEAKKKPRARKK